MNPTMNHRLLRVAVIAAMAANLALITGAAAQNAASPSAVPTPRTPDGKPDLTGMWGGGAGQDSGSRRNEFGIVRFVESRRCAPGQNVPGLPKGDCVNQEIDGEFSGRSDPNRPLYKPEHWDRIQYLDENTNSEDPIFQCQPQGITRVGPPRKIVQLPNEVILFYAVDGSSTSPRDFRIIPTDRRKHVPSDFEGITFWGKAIGQWEGDTLVVDSVGFNDLTWLEKGGLFHSDKLHVVERFQRVGNVLNYSVTVDDKDVLLEPWAPTPQRLRLNTDRNATIPETDPCVNYESDNLAKGSKIRH